MMDTETGNSDARMVPSKRKLKKIASRIRKQMEFYFSDSNLAKDKFLQDLIEKSSDGYVDVNIFTTFNKIKHLTQDADLIADAISKSNILKVSDDGKKVKRIVPMDSSRDFDACTIYVEKLPPHADIKWVKDIFEQFGTVDYVNVPHFKASNKIKGFAFVEFHTPESVTKACEYYKALSIQETSTSEEESKETKDGKKKRNEDTHEKTAKRRKPRSTSESAADDTFDQDTIKTHQQDVHKSAKLPHSVGKEKHVRELHTNVKKRKRRNSDSDLPSKKLKEANCENDNSETINVNNQKFQHHGDNETDMKSEDQELSMEKSLLISERSENAETLHDKMKRKRRRVHIHIDRPLLKVMSKAEWKSYRNKYLELQRATMSYLKKSIMLETQKLKLQDVHSKAAVGAPETVKKGVQFQPGVIIKISLPEPVKNSSAIKDLIKTSATAAYIDAPVEQSEIYIRCHNSEDAQTIINEKKLNHLGSTALLKDTEEDDYWKKIKSDRQAKFNSPLVHKKRGRDKIIAKAAKLEEQKNRHIFFDE